MPHADSKSTAAHKKLRPRSASNVYRGKQTRTGNSLGFRFDGALFKSHPEFAGEVSAHVIAPGRMLVAVVEPLPERVDPVMESFLAFLANDIAIAPGVIQPLSRDLMNRIGRLVKDVEFSPEASVGEESIL
jgi:prlF antitoxin for toxin YhaV_toxin